MYIYAFVGMYVYIYSFMFAHVYIQVIKANDFALEPRYSKVMDNDGDLFIYIVLCLRMCTYR
jgi:hypothetical protein